MNGASQRRVPPPHWGARRRPQGQITRGKTAQNRLRRVDLFFLRYDPAVIRREDGPYDGAFLVDLGYGAEPFTTLETAARLRRLNPGLRVLGVEIDPARVAAAAPFADAQTFFRRGGFNLPLGLQPDGRPETVRAIRAFNVLRQYDESEVAAAYDAMAAHALPGALLVEGTSDPFGRVWVANVARRAAASACWDREAIVFSTNFRAGFEPAIFQPVLPKDAIHRMQPGEPIYELLEAWKTAARRTLPERAWGLRRWFHASALALAEAGFAVDQRRRWLDQGYLVVHTPFSSKS